VNPGWFVLHRLRPPGDRRHDEYGRCSVCGVEGRFRFNSWILPPDMVRDLGDAVHAFRRRESLWCGGCGASLRVRRIADVLVEHYADRAQTLAELVEERRFASLSVAEINSIGTAHNVLARHPRLTYSEYPEEDVTALSYADASFDLVLTSDTLEHVADWKQALRETHRVLRAGGRHVFTVPAVPSRAATTSREGLPPQHHAQASGLLRLLSRAKRHDMLAYTDFGLDLTERLRETGFEAEVHGRQDAAALVFCAQAV
jgi:SAM-dependent methyltransferase